MDRLSAPSLCKVYLLLVLLAATIISPLPHSLPALVLLLAILFTVIRPQTPGISVVLMAAVVFIAPLALAPMVGQLPNLPPTAARLIAVVLVFPAGYLLDYNLRQRTRRVQEFTEGSSGRHVTPVFISLFVSALVMMLLSPVLDSPVLLITGIAFSLYLLGVLIAAIITIPRLPLTTPVTRKRIIAGTTGNIPMHITSRASVSLHTRLSPTNPWLSASPPEFILKEAEAKLKLSLTPPLAGQAKPPIRVSATDSRGFVQINQVLEPLQLHIIPRAKYAEWLARKYLEQNNTGVVTAAALPQRAATITKRGTEYYESRYYQPGDQLKDIDWKHTSKLRQLIVKEYTETDEHAAVIAVNLTVTDAEEADKLAFNLITTSLTLAVEGIPTALAAYNHQRPILTTTTLDPNDILRQAMSLVGEINLEVFSERRLDPYNIAKIKRNIRLLQRADSEPAQRLLGMLNFEYRAIEEAARNHPATIALSTVTSQSPRPAMVLLISQLNHDAEAVLVTAEKLARRKFTTIPIEAA